MKWMSGESIQLNPPVTPQWCSGGLSQTPPPSPPLSFSLSLSLSLTLCVCVCVCVCQEAAGCGFTQQRQLRRSYTQTFKRTLFHAHSNLRKTCIAAETKNNTFKSNTFHNLQSKHQKNFLYSFALFSGHAFVITCQLLPSLRLLSEHMVRNQSYGLLRKTRTTDLN